MKPLKSRDTVSIVHPYICLISLTFSSCSSVNKVAFVIAKEMSIRIWKRPIMHKILLFNISRQMGFILIRMMAYLNTAAFSYLYKLRLFITTQIWYPFLLIFVVNSVGSVDVTITLATTSNL